MVDERGDVTCTQIFELVFALGGRDERGGFKYAHVMIGILEQIMRLWKTRFLGMNYNLLWQTR